MIQSKEELDKWYSKEDPWDYENETDDVKRREILLSELPNKKFKSVLDIGCGNGFITKELPGEEVIGVDFSDNAIKFAQKYSNKRLKFIQGNIFGINKLLKQKFDLIIITGVLYKQYIGDSERLIYDIIDDILEEDGYLVSVHINEWYKAKFPYLTIKEYYYDYREYRHLLEIYIK